MERVIVITGTRKGIGKSLSEFFLTNGDFVIGCSRGESSIEHKNYEHFELDVADEKSVVAMISSVRKKYRKIDVLINNAGIASMNHIITTPYQTVKNIFQTNVFGTFLFVREVSKVMIKHKFGRIVNFSTVATPLRLEGEAIYAASKAAIINFTEISSRELAMFGITVNGIGPTPVPTDLIKNVPKNKIDSLLERQAIKRLGNFDDMLNVINFFIDAKSDFITGQIVNLGGVTG